MSKWVAWLYPLLQLIHRILDKIEARGRQYDHEERQQKRDAAADNPRDAFDKHFNGRVLADDSDGDAPEARKTDPKH